MKREIDVILLDTTNRTKLFLSNFNKILNISNSRGYYHTGKHIYIVSNDEIVENDWYIDDTNTIRKSITSDKIYWSVRKDYRKIIATTDKSLYYINHDDSVSYPKGKQIFLPEPSKNFIDFYINEYNKGNIITKALVEYYDIGGYRQDSMNGCWISKWKLKINLDNIIDIYIPKNNWDKNELKNDMYNMLSDYFLEIRNNIQNIKLADKQSYCENIVNKWIKNEYE